MAGLCLLLLCGVRGWGSAGGLWGVAERAFAQGLYPAASESLLSLLRDYPTDALADDAEFLLALCRVYTGNYDQAARSLEQYARRYPGSPHVRTIGYWLGYSRYRLGHLEEATAAFRSQAEGYPEEARYRLQALSYLGELYERSGNPEAALAASRGLLEEGATGEMASHALYRIGSITLDRGDYAQALTAFARIRLEHAASDVAVRALFYEARALETRSAGTEAALRYRGFLDSSKTGAGAGESAALREGAYLALARLAAAEGDNSAVLDSLSRLASEMPSSSRLAETHTLRAQALFDRGDLGGARTAYAAALARTRDPNERQRLAFNLAVCAAALGDLGAALGGLEEASGGPDAGIASKSLYRQAALHAQMDHPEQAIPLLQQVARSGTGDEETLRFLGELLETEGRSAESAAVWGALVAGFPLSAELPRYLYRQGGAALATRDHAVALEAFGRLVRDAGDGPESADLVAQASYGMGSVYADRGEYVRSLPYFAQASARTALPDLKTRSLYAQAVAAYNTQDYDGASAAFASYARMVADPMAQARGLLGGGKADLRAGRLGEAERAFQSASGALAGSPEGAESAYWLGIARTRLGRNSEAVEAFIRLATEYPDDPRAAEGYLRAGVMARLAGDLEASRMHLDQALARLPARDRTAAREEALYEMIATRLALGHSSEARRLAAQLGREYPQGSLAPEGLLRMAQATYETGQYLAAAGEFEAVGRTYPGSDAAGAASYWIGECWQRAGQTDRAIEAYWEYLKRSPTGSYAGTAEASLVRLIGEQADTSRLRVLYEAAERESDVPPSVAYRVRLEYARILAGLGRTTEAAIVLRGVEADGLVEPHRGEALLLAARIERSMGRLDAALPVLSTLAQSRLDRVGAEALLELGLALAEAKRPQEAVAELLRLTVLFAQYRDLVPRALRSAARLLEAGGDKEAAARLDRRLADEFPDLPGSAP
jgi:TolA-binding protein